jgi:hypothetical protein
MRIAAPFTHEGASGLAWRTGALQRTIHQRHDIISSLVRAGSAWGTSPQSAATAFAPFAATSAHAGDMPPLKVPWWSPRKCAPHFLVCRDRASQPGRQARSDAAQEGS